MLGTSKKVERALIEEVRLSPKPGLVDLTSNGSHEDMDYSLFIRSAITLTPYFYKMAQAAFGRPINQKLREEIARIGREAEIAMFQATNQINTHKGAIWALGLFVSVTSNQISQESKVNRERLFDAVAKLAAYPDRAYEETLVTHGQNVQKRFNVSGALGEARAGYPHVKLALNESAKHPLEPKENRYLHMLLALICSLEDTCILYRSDKQTLEKVHFLASEANRAPLPNTAFYQLIEYCESQRISPGGSADLLAVSIFILSLEEWTVEIKRTKQVQLEKGR